LILSGLKKKRGRRQGLEGVRRRDSCYWPSTPIWLLPQPTWGRVGNSLNGLATALLRISDAILRHGTSAKLQARVNGYLEAARTAPDQFDWQGWSVDRQILGLVLEKGRRAAMIAPPWPRRLPPQIEASLAGRLRREARLLAGPRKLRRAAKRSACPSSRSRGWSAPLRSPSAPHLADRAGWSTGAPRHRSLPMGTSGERVTEVTALE
jgi:hypothetical protein